MESQYFGNFKWLNQPKKFVLEESQLVIETEPGTDFWKRTYYGFQNTNAPAFLTEMEGDFSFTVKTEFEEAAKLYDQCGVLLYIDDENWIKVSAEYENEEFMLLGSVVTNLGYSDWATVDIPAMISRLWYRLNRRGQDFCIESSTDGEHYKQMRILHMHKPIKTARVGAYACSPLQSSFKAASSEFNLGPCEWPAYFVEK